MKAVYSNPLPSKGLCTNFKFCFFTSSFGRYQRDHQSQRSRAGEYGCEAVLVP
jgi:hypothetical protein